MIPVYLLGGTHSGEVIEVPENKRSIVLDEALRITTIDALEGRTGGRPEQYSFLLQREGMTIFSAQRSEWSEAAAIQYLLARGLVKLSDATNEELEKLNRDIDPTTDVAPPVSQLAAEMRRRGLL